MALISVECRQKKNNGKLYLFLNLLPFLALLISSGPLLSLEYPKGHDWIYELIRVSEYKTALAHGQYPPYWAENLYGGYGSPIFLFYAPLFMFIATLGSFVAGSIAGGSKLALLLFSVLGLVGIKKTLQAASGPKTFETEAASRIAAYLFILNPYLVSDKLLRNANAEYTALCLSPLVLYGLLLIGTRPKAGGRILALSLALIICAHNLTALVIMALTIVAAFVLYSQAGPPRLTHYWTIIGSIVLGLSLSAFFWLPALYYKNLIRIDQLTTGKFDFRYQFHGLSDFFGFEHFFSTGLLIPLILVCAAVCLLLICKRREWNGMRFVFLVFAGSLIFIFLQTRSSIFFWEKMPFMPLFQFPWRMMGPFAIVTSILGGLSFGYFCRGKSTKCIVSAEIIILSLCVINAAPNLKTARALGQNGVDKLAYLIAAETIKTKKLSATVRNEYLPPSADSYVWQVTTPKTDPLLKIAPEIKVMKRSASSTRISFASNAEVPATLEFMRWNFPGWQCVINGEPHVVETNKLGTVVVSVPAGRNQGILTLHPPLLRQIGIGLSLAVLTGWGLSAILPAIQRRWNQRK
jgi:hypothetical protein